MVRQHLEVRKLIVLEHLNTRRSGMRTTNNIEKVGEEELKDILAEENKLLGKSVARILQSRERQVGIHLVTFNELKGYITTNLYGV